MKQELTVGAEVVYEDDLVDQRRGTSQQDAGGGDRKDNEERGSQQRSPFIRPAAASFSVSLPFDSAEKSGASLVVESDDDAGGGKIAVVAHRCAPTQRRAQNPSHHKIGLLRRAGENILRAVISSCGPGHSHQHLLPSNTTAAQVLDLLL